MVDVRRVRGRSTPQPPLLGVHPLHPVAEDGVVPLQLQFEAATVTHKVQSDLVVSGLGLLVVIVVVVGEAGGE